LFHITAEYIATARTAGLVAPEVGRTRARILRGRPLPGLFSETELPPIPASGALPTKRFCRGRSPEDRSGTPENDSSGQSRGHVAGPGPDRAQPEQHRPARGNQFPPPSCLPRARVRPHLDNSAALKGRTPAGRSPCGEPPDLMPPGSVAPSGDLKALGKHASVLLAKPTARRSPGDGGGGHSRPISFLLSRTPAGRYRRASAARGRRGPVPGLRGIWQRGRSGGCLAA
jgi:hypothetical protein